MITDLTLLKLFFSERRLFDQYGGYVQKEALNLEAKTILVDLGIFYTQFPEMQAVDMEQFSTWFHQIQHPDYNETRHGLADVIFKRIYEEEVDLECPDAFTLKVLKYFREEDYRARLQRLLESPNWSVDNLKSLVLEAETELARELDDDTEFEPNDPEVFCKVLDRSKGLKWHVNSIQNCLGSMVPGEFGFVAAGVDAGKSTFLVSETVNFAHQLIEGKILWITTEQTPKKVLTRIWAKALGITAESLSEDWKEAKPAYTAFMNGDVNRIQVYDGHGYDVPKIGRLIRKHKPKLVIIDMLDHIKLPGLPASNDWGYLKQLYHAIRMEGRDCHILGSSQCNAETKGTYGPNCKPPNNPGDKWFIHYIPMEMLEGSKIGKQGAADYIITIGHDDRYPSTRYLSVVKSKTGKYMKSEAIFNADTVTFTNHQVY